MSSNGFQVLRDLDRERGRKKLFPFEVEIFIRGKNNTPRHGAAMLSDEAKMSLELGSSTAAQPSGKATVMR
jgi:hypothetical protein